MRILFLSGLYPPRTQGGAEVSTHILARQLILDGHTVHVVTEGTARREQEIDGVPVLADEFGMTRKPLLERISSRGIAGRLLPELGGVDIVHAHDFRSAMALGELIHRGAIASKQTVVTVRDYAQVCGTTNAVLRDGSRCSCSVPDIMQTQRFQEVGLSRRLARLWQYRYNLAYRKRIFRVLPRHVYLSHAHLRETSQQQDLSGVTTHVVYNPVSDNFLRLPLRQGTAGNVLYLGRVETYKGVEVLVRAWRAIQDMYGHARLTIAGEGAQRELYEQMVARYGMQYSVSFAGHVRSQHVLDLIDDAAVLVAPHVWVEPYGRTVVEAMARGKIVVASNKGGPGEIITDGKTGFLVRSGSSEDLGHALKRVLSMPKADTSRIGRQARNWVQDTISPQHIAGQYVSIYKECL